MKLWNIFSRKKESSFFSKLRKLNLGKIASGKIEKVFFLGAMVYTTQNLESIRQAISSRELGQFLTNNSCNSQKDNIEVYWVESEDGKAQILLIRDAFELYQKEEILGMVPVTIEILDSFINKEQIYPF